MYGRERLIVSAGAVALPGVIVAQVAAALGCAAAGYRSEAPAIEIAVFALVITAVQGWLGWLLRGGRLTGSVRIPDLASSGPFSACLHPAVSTIKPTSPASPSLSGEKTLALGPTTEFSDRAYAKQPGPIPSESA